MAWMTTTEVLEHFAICEHTLRAWVEESVEAGISVPRIALGRIHRYNGAKVDDWALELTEWQASRKPLLESGKSDGESETLEQGSSDHALGASRPSGRRRGSSKKSSKPKTSDRSGAAELRALRR